jgi:hypothetical protein
MNQHNNTLKEESKMSLRKLVVVMLLLLACGVNASAQKVITGTVTELFGTTKEPIIGANVVLVNSQNRYVKGVVTDMNGNYSIQVPSDAGNLRIKF